MSDIVDLAYFSPGTIMPNQLIPRSVGGGTWPHKVDVYVPRLTPLRALVCLHGGGGTKTAHAAALRVLLRRTATPTPLDVRWDLLDYWRLVAVFPQGQACLIENAVGNPFNPNGVDTRSETYPNGVATWDNGHMYSSADDKAFLVDLRLWLLATFPYLGAQAVHIEGHSNGGMMVQRMWREQPVYRCHACISGPASRPYLATPYDPSTVRPLWMQYGAFDDVLGLYGGIAGAGSHWLGPWLQQPEQLSKANVYGYMGPSGWVPQLSEYQPGHVTFDLGALEWVDRNPGVFVPPYEYDDVTAVVTDAAEGTLTTWASVDNRIKLRLLSDAGHALRDQQTKLGKALISQILRWIVFETT